MPFVFFCLVSFDFFLTESKSTNYVITFFDNYQIIGINLRVKLYNTFPISVMTTLLHIVSSEEMLICLAN